jgi:hypothetical protein
VSGFATGILTNGSTLLANLNQQRTAEDAVNLNSRCAIGDSGAQNHAPTANPLASNCVRKCYESCSRSRCQQFVADHRRSTTSTRTESGAGENACERHLLHRRTSDARTLSRTISPNLRPRARARSLPWLPTSRRGRWPTAWVPPGFSPPAGAANGASVLAGYSVPTWAQELRHKGGTPSTCS